MKPSIPKGTRDFSPSEMTKRNFIFDTIRTVYQRYGYQQIETPSMELAATLTGKYGDEGDKLIFRILESGDFIDSHLKDLGSVYRIDDLQDFEIEFNSEFNTELNDFIHRRLLESQIKTSHESVIREKIKKFILEFYKSKISEKALRYDLTVPFARYVVQHQNEITFPFKRFQIQPVWRADRPQKGRYREFYQCDADVIGSDSLLNEVELIQIIGDVFSQVNIQVAIKLNNRKILSGIAETTGVGDRIIELTVAIDKIDKIGIDGVKKELLEKGFSENAIVWLDQIANNKNQLGVLENFLSFSEVGKKGIAEIKEVMNYFSNIQHPTSKIEFDVTLARGLNYYTGTIIEVKVSDPRSTFTSSICGGGRYDDLTGIFGLPNVSGVGISFGADRIYDVLEEINGFPDLSGASTKIMFVNFGKEEAAHCLKLLKQLRDAGINSELFPDAAKMKKQMGYADDKKIPFVALIGSEEMKNQEITIKNMLTGEQFKTTLEKLIPLLK